ncbi:unnamed protein product [Paramecium sonneborni]|uniref:Uncharacterized protein n=1 Tax=Paramecium sonneborni TaxID=65129 RepID=A0A8S1RLN0_9CILI|nr:unnamed protein product [Paramecium sonneborni]
MVFIYYCLLVWKIQMQELIDLESENQITREAFSFQIEDFSENSCFTYGIWSKYLPLSGIGYGGTFENQDSDCYQLHTITEQNSQSLNLIYYDCVDPISKTIKKKVEFIGDDDIHYEFQFFIDSFEYENIWYYFQIFQWPVLQRFDLIIVQQSQIKIHKILEKQTPFIDIDILLTFGGDMKVTNSKISNIKIDQIFSQFPGKILLQEFQIYEQDPLFDFKTIIQEKYESLTICNCNSDQNILNNIDIEYQEIEFYDSQEFNCDSFTLMSWIKIKEIIQNSDGFTYTLIKLVSNLQNDDYQNDNLAAFQLKYIVNADISKIIVQTYSYTFPSLRIDFSENPFILQKIFDVQKLTNFWHHILVILSNNEMDVQINIFDESINTKLSTKFYVKQFMNIKFKVYYGNIKEMNINYLKVEMKNLIFDNCNQLINDQICHSSCKECDGPTENNCLSCLESSFRFLIPQYKVCICQFQTIEQDGKCQGINDINGELIILEENNIECEQGFFEIEGECLKCPSIVDENGISCLNCYLNPSGWSNSFQCSKQINIDQTTSQIDTKYYSNIYSFDGQELNYCPYCLEEESWDFLNIYNLYLYLFREFQYFCFGNRKTEDEDNMDYFEIAMSHKCSDCDYCNECIITSTGFECMDEIYYTFIEQTENLTICDPPYYLNFAKQCINCPIANCIYCFEYRINNPLINTLLDSFVQIESLSNIKLGCAICNDNFIYDFNIGECIFQVSSIPNCLRAFVSLMNQEICTLSIGPEFDISPEIINCQSYINQCSQCYRMDEFEIICITCNSGYVFYQNACQLYEEIEQIDYKDFNWTQRVQSFKQQFQLSLDENVYQLFKFHSSITNTIIDVCDSKCKSCIINYEEVCLDCGLNYYKQQIKTIIGEKCSDCSQLCRICFDRSDQEIKTINQHFLIEDNTKLLTKKCYLPQNDPNIKLNPYTQTTKYCLNGICNYALVFQRKGKGCEVSRFNKISINDNDISFLFLQYMGIEIIQFKLQLFTPIQQNCIYLGGLLAFVDEKSRLFNLKRINILIYTLQFFNMQFDVDVETSQFDSVQFQNLGFIFKSESTARFQFDNKNQIFDLTFLDCTIQDSYLNKSKSVLNTLRFGNINFTNVTILNTIFDNTSFLNLPLWQLEGKIIINKMHFINCTFFNSNVFIIGNDSFIFTINNLIIELCSFQNSYFLNLVENLNIDNYLTFQSLTIKNSNFTNSYFLLSLCQVELKIINFQFNSNKIHQSVILGINYNLQFEYITIQDNSFQNSQFLLKSQNILRKQVYCSINHLQIDTNSFDNSSIVTIFSTYQLNNLIVSFNNFLIENNFRSHKTNLSSYMFLIYSNQLDLNNINVFNTNDLLIFYFIDNYILIIKNVIFENNEIQTKVPFSLICLESFDQKNQLMQIFGFVTINIHNVKIINKQSIDKPIIEFISSKSFQDYTQRELSIKNVLFKGNKLLQKNEVVHFSLLSISSDNAIKILFEDFDFQNNVMHSYVESSQRFSASLIYIISTSSSVSINKLTSYQNAFTNSTNPFIYLNSQEIILKNFNIKNHNSLNQEVWQSNYDIQLDRQLNQEDINQLIFSTYQINNIGGVAQIIASKILCLNSTFDQIIASKGSIFDIVTLDSGIVIISNIQISSTRNYLKQAIDTSGCLNINSQNSYLHLEIRNSNFYLIFNRISSSILSINPSIFRNSIILVEIQILDCISLFNSFIKGQFSKSIADLNYVKISKVNVIQNKAVFQDYMQLIESLSQAEIKDISSETRGFIYLENCKVLIEECFIEGLQLGSILQVINSPKLNIHNLILDNIFVLYSLNLIVIQQNLEKKQSVLINSLFIRKSRIFNLEQPLKQKMKFYFQYFIEECKYSQSQISIKEDIDYFFNNAILLQQENNETSALLYFQSISHQNQIQLTNIQLSQNNCSNCINGMIFFDLDNFAHLNVENLICDSNLIHKYGCLLAQSKKFISSKMIIQNSNFIYNYGNIGNAAMILNIQLIIKGCKIIYNNASESGGGLYLKLNSNQFLIKNTIITNNLAKFGGGIYLNGDSNLIKLNFIQSFLNYNQATQYANNLIEIPTHLTVTINSLEQPFYIEKIKNSTVSILNLKPYKVIEQGKLKISEQLMLPSNQKILDYQIFLIQKKMYISYINSFELNFKNSKNEKLINWIDSSCQINEIINAKNQSLIENQNVKTIMYNNTENKINLGQLQFSFNPYESSYNYLQIQISCLSEFSKNKISYLIKTNSFKCQIGEFFVDSGCQICQSNQGYYSVIYDSLKCSIFDKQKFSNITSNMIKLLEGTWRPNYLSDYTEFCLKNKQFCKGGWEVGNNLCTNGHIGALCEECDIYNIRGNGQYFKNLWDLDCYECFGNDSSIFPFIFSIIQVLLSITLTLKSIDRSNQLFKSLKMFQKQSKILYKLNQDHESILIKMLLNYLWIFSVIFSFNITFQFQFHLITTTSNSFYIMANNLDCYLLDFGIKLLYLRIFLIFFLVLLQFQLILIGLFIYSQLIKQQMDNSLLSNTLLYLFVFNYGGLIRMFCSALSARNISNINYVQGDVSLEFETNDHQTWIYIFIIPGLILFGVLLPLCLSLFMYFNRFQLDQIKLRKHICYLFNEYSNNTYFWEYIKLAKKAIIILITTYFESSILLKSSLLGFCLLIYQQLTFTNKPYHISKYNNLDLLAGQICSLSIFLATTKYVSEDANNQFVSVLLSIVIIILCLKLLYPFIINIAKVYYKKYKFQLLKLFLKILIFINKRSIVAMKLRYYIDFQQNKEQQLRKNYKILQNHFTNKKIYLKFQPYHRQISTYSSLDQIKTMQPKSLTSAQNEKK